ncbi:type VI immunity family protein [Methylobacterium terrae]|nr:type VI immunity family protein [Methylobacterium terrae]
MSISHLIADSKFNLADLDCIGVRSARGNSSLRLGHYVDMSIDGGDNVELKQVLSRLILDYVETFRENITHYHPHDSLQLAPLGEVSLVTYLDNRAQAPYDYDENQGFDAAVYGFPEGLDNEEPTLYFMNVTSATPHRRFSSASAYIPASWPEVNGYGLYISLVKRWCEWIRPSYGTAGLSVVFNEGQESLEDRLTAFPLIKRFIGLDMPESSRWYSIMNRQNQRSIRTINWLTIIDETFINVLGGLQSLRNSLTEDCLIHPFEGGIIIQAGARPVLGDINLGLSPPAYKSVAHALKSIRFENYPRPLLDAPAPLDSMEETLKWIRRFD